MQGIVKHSALLGIGSNLNDPVNQCRIALEQLDQLPRTQVIQSSSFYQSNPLVHAGDPTSIPSYINFVCQVETELEPLSLFRELQNLEIKMGRVRKEKWESRIIDLDLLFYDQLILNNKELILPHPEIQNRSFVLHPLKEIVPDWIYPVFKKTILELAENLKENLHIQKIN